MGMNVSEITTTPQVRTIIQLDLDYFYAQAEEVMDPRKIPVGIQQKHIIVTCNYKARELGVKKLQLLTTALEKCPTLRVISGEDISKYRRFGRNIGELLRALLNGPMAVVEDPTGSNPTPCPSSKKPKWSVPVERLGLDEVFLDVTEAIEAHLIRVESGKGAEAEAGDHGIVWPDGEVVFRLPGCFVDAGRPLESSSATKTSSKKGTAGGPAAKKMAAIMSQLGGWAAGFSYKADMFEDDTLIVGDEDYSDLKAGIDWSLNYGSENVQGPTEAPSERDRWRNHEDLQKRQLQHLRIASYLAKHIRAMLHATTGFTTSAGIASSKLHAKLAAGTKKPDGQTVLIPFSRAATSLVNRMDVRRVQGIGYRAYTTIRDFIDQGGEEFGVWRAAMGASYGKTDAGEEGEDSDAMMAGNLREGGGIGQELHPQGWGDEDQFLSVQRVRESVPIDGWEVMFGKNGAKLCQLIHGIDDSTVVSTGWPTQISVEDSFSRCTTLEDARTRLLDLTHSLIDRFQDEESYDVTGPTRRIASQLRLTLRRRHPSSTSYNSHRESQSMPMPPDFHDSRRPSCDRANDVVDKALIPMLKRILSGSKNPVSFPTVATGTPGFDITLLNVAAVKLREKEGERSVASMLKDGSWGRKKEIEEDPIEMEKLGIDMETFGELPVNLRREILSAGVKQQAVELSLDPIAESSQISEITVEDIGSFPDLPSREPISDWVEEMGGVEAVEDFHVPIQSPTLKRAAPTPPLPPKRQRTLEMVKSRSSSDFDDVAVDTSTSLPPFHRTPSSTSSTAQKPSAQDVHTDPPDDIVDDFEFSKIDPDVFKELPAHIRMEDFGR
ncbi:hypothetical protein BC829DRAFT_491477 [Chytridium lagenaria]|nr:hypothetical protein BC829DRAFT_491477 [Chytridium lagenaria]